MGLIFRGQINRPLTPSELDANFSYFTGSQSITGSITISGSIIPIGSSSNLGSVTNPWAELFVSTGSVSFVNSSNQIVAAIKAKGEPGDVNNPINGIVYIASITGSNGLRGSFAVGSNASIASGTGSFSQGADNSSIGNYSHAQGSKTFARGYAAHSEGFNTIALGEGSHTEGIGTIASGSYQTVVGQYNIANASQSAFIIGDGVSASSRKNVLFVSRSWFEVSASNVFLKSLSAVNQTNVLTYNTTTGQVSYTASSAFGGGGGGGTPGGNNTNIQYNNNGTFGGSNLHTFAITPDPDYAIVSLSGSFNQGRDTTASGQASHAEGRNTSASGWYSHAEGWRTIASGTYSHAEGKDTLAQGTYSHAAGEGTIALGAGQFIVGQYNISNSNPSSFIIGNGLGNFQRSNLLEANGNYVNITGSLNVIGTASFSEDIKIYRGSTTSGNYMSVGRGTYGIETNVAIGTYVLAQNQLSDQSFGRNTGVGFVSLVNLISGSWNTAVGAFSLANLLNGSGNTGFGYGAGTNLGQGLDAISGYNTAIGVLSLAFPGDVINTRFCTSIGAQSQYQSSGSYNTTLGAYSMMVASGSYNIGIGLSSLSGVRGGQNVGIGSATLSGVDGGNNVAVGHESFQALQSGSSNTALGYNAGGIWQGNHNLYLGNNAGAHNIGGIYTTQSYSVFIGSAAGLNKFDDYNIGIGYYALSVGSGSYNVVIGSYAGGNSVSVTKNISQNVIIGDTAGIFLVSGSKNIIIGPTAGPTGLYPTYASSSNKLYIDTQAGNPLIGADFSDRTMTVSGSLFVSGTVNLLTNTSAPAGGNDGDIKLVQVGGSYFFYAKINGAWRSASLA